MTELPAVNVLPAIVTLFVAANSEKVTVAFSVTAEYVPDRLDQPVLTWIAACIRLASSANWAGPFSVSVGSKLVSRGVAFEASAAKMLSMVMVLASFKPAGVVRLTVKSLKWLSLFSLPKRVSENATLSSAKLEPAAVPVIGAEFVASGVMVN